ncbi:MAG: MOSC domain-containing protein, partial [Roseomonas sp.]|nr:MOSC domain-containing protein [Roseomonas sp.]
MTTAYIQALASDGTHRFSKQPVESLTLIAGMGVAADAHAGVTVKHRSHVARDPSQPNLRQLHLLHAEIFEELALQGFALKPG